jgi:divalent anion:Na+ symporter, DASS family
MTADAAGNPSPSLRGTGVRLWRIGPVIGVPLVLWWVPPPGGLAPSAVHLTALFLGAILGLILQPLPQGAVVLAAVAVAALTGTLPIQDVLAGYSDSTVWLIVTAFLLARGFIHTGLGRRIAFLLVRAFGRSTLGLGYALTFADAIIAPATPSNTARAGGILFPIVRSLASCLGSEPGPTAKRVGAFLVFNEFQSNLVTSAMFLTAVAPNALMAKLASDTFGYRITWLGWLWAALVPACISLAVLPAFIYRLLRPELRRSPDATLMAAAELIRMGPMSRGERRMLAVFAATLLLWATGQWTGINATAIAVGGVSALVVLGVLTWDDVIGERGAWDALLWFGGLVSLAAGMGKLGVIGALATALKTGLSGFHPWPVGFVLLVLAYTYSHYLVASMTAHATALYVPLALVAVTLGAPAGLVLLVMGFMNSLNAAMTTYGTGPAPIYYGAGYVDAATWWRAGFAVSIVNVTIWLVSGWFWWRWIGIWQ